MSQSVLLIEQDAILRGQYRSQFESKYQVHTAQSAQVAIDILDSAESKVDIIVMDVNVDNNNGVELIHELKSYDDWLDIPIIILSSIPLSRFKQQSFERYGVKEFLYKPMTAPSHILKIVNRTLRA